MAGTLLGGQYGAAPAGWTAILVCADPLSLVLADMSSPRVNRYDCRVLGPGEDAISGVVLAVVAVLADLRVRRLTAFVDPEMETDPEQRPS